MPKLTHQQKLDALSYRFYQGAQWEPKAGDFYTTSRADLELYQIVDIKDGVVFTRYTEGSEAIATWSEKGFLTEGFGPKRVFVPPWVMEAPVRETIWQSMDSAPINGTEFLAISRWASGSLHAHVYKYEGHPNYWHCRRDGLCIRPEYQHRYLWAPLPKSFTDTKASD